MSLIDTNLDDLKFEIQEETRKGARIKVVGVGGGGSNAVARMIHEGLEGVEFHILNTDAQALAASSVPNRLQIGERITGGLGAGSNPAIGRQAALENTDAIIEILHGADMVFVAAGLGGGTGAGAAPVVASLAKDLDALTVAVVTKPFQFEGGKRMKQANQSMVELASSVDTLIAIPNDRLLSIVPRGTSMAEAFRFADDILRQAVQGISDIITTPGLINLDFSDIKTTMLGMGYAMMGTATASGENAALEAARQAINSPLLEDTKIAGSKHILINLTGSSRLGLHEINEACSIIRNAADCDDVEINFGVIVNEMMADAVKITVIATGFQPENLPAPRRPVVSANLETKPQPVTPEPMLPLMEPEPAPAPVAAAEPEPVMDSAYLEPPASHPKQVIQMAEPAFDPEDLETPAYLRRGRMIQ